MAKEDIPLASLEASPLHPHTLKFDISPIVTVDWVETNSFGDEVSGRYSYHNEPGIIEAHTIPLNTITPTGERSARQVADHIMKLLWGKIAPGAGVSESATILDVSKQRVHQLMTEGKMPKPHQILAATPLWQTIDVTTFALEREKEKAEKLAAEGVLLPIAPPTLQIEQICDHGYRFSDLTSPNHIIVREHFSDFQAGQPYVTKQAAMLLFNYLVDGDNFYPLDRRTRMRTYRPHEMAPMPKGDIQVVKREAVGLPPHEDSTVNGRVSILSQYGIIAGSVLSAQANQSIDFKTKTVTAETFELLASQLREQMPEEQPVV